MSADIKSFADAAKKKRQDQDITGILKKFGLEHYIETTAYPTFQNICESLLEQPPINFQSQALKGAYIIAFTDYLKGFLDFENKNPAPQKVECGVAVPAIFVLRNLQRTAPSFLKTHGDNENIPDALYALELAFFINPEVESRREAIRDFLGDEAYAYIEKSDQIFRDPALYHSSETTAAEKYYHLHHIGRQCSHMIANTKKPKAEALQNATPMIEHIEKLPLNGATECEQKIPKILDELKDLASRNRPLPPSPLPGKK